MKLTKFKKILIGGLLTTVGAGAAIGISVGLLNNNQSTNYTNGDVQESPSDIVTSNKNNNANLGFSATKNDFSKAYSFSLAAKEETQEDTLSQTEYVITIDNNIQKEGVIYLVGKDGQQANELSFKPGDTIEIGIILNEGYQDHTARDLKVFGKNENIFVPSAKVENKENMFKVVMPKYEDTVDKKTGESWLYDKDVPIKVMPTFIKTSIGTENNKVDWEHGAFHDALNGYVYELSKDTTWSTVKTEIYKTFENKDINYPIDIYFYMNGNNITFDVTEINLDIPSGWALHFYNNKYDKKADNGKYGEIIVPQGQKATLPVNGAVVLGSSVKFRMYTGVNGVVFVNYDDSSFVADDIKNDPVVRLGQ